MNHQLATQPPDECASTMRRCMPYLDDELEATEGAEVRSHLESCALCRDYFKRERSFTTSLKNGLGGNTDQDTGKLARRVVATLRASEERQAAEAVPQIWPRVLATAALLILGAFIGSTGTVAYQHNQSTVTQTSPDLAAHLNACCGLANDVLSDGRARGGYEQAAAEYEKAFPGSRLPRTNSNSAPKPRLFGTTNMCGERVNWVVYCTGAGAEPDFTERFVLLTMNSETLEKSLSGIQQMEASIDGLNLLAWHDSGQFRVLVTKRNSSWAREQAAELGQA